MLMEVMKSMVVRNSWRVMVILLHHMVGNFVAFG